MRSTFAPPFPSFNYALMFLNKNIGPLTIYLTAPFTLESRVIDFRRFK